MLITFSGLDGSGKSTFIAQAKLYLEEKGRYVKVLTMYDHVTFFSFIRRLRDRCFAARSGKKPGFAQKLVDRTKGSPLLRQLVYFIDLVIFAFLNIYYTRIKGKVLVLDRYFYDSLVDILINEEGVASDRWSYVNTFLAIIPRPAISVLLDVEGATATLRKNEYPAEYNELRRGLYFKVFSRVKNKVIIKNDKRETALAALFESIHARID